MRESKFQKRVIDELKVRFPDCIVMKTDSSYIQGIPDLIFLWNDKWASLEVKRCATATHQPNQDYWVEKMNNMSFSAFIFPENFEEVLNDLQRSFEAQG